jgi:hypothetical protein
MVANQYSGLGFNPKREGKASPQQPLFQGNELDTHTGFISLVVQKIQTNEEV